MIKNYLLPNKINGYYLFNEKIAAVNIKNDRLDVIIMSASGNSTKLVDGFTIYFESDLENVGQDPVETALKELILKIKNINYVLCNIQNNQVIFKEFEIALKSRDKIKLVLPFELESTMPFKKDDSSVDFIVLDQKKETNSTKIMVAICQDKITNSIEANFLNAGIKLQKIIPNALATYGYISEKNIISDLKYFVINVQKEYVTITHVFEGKLKNIRTIPKKFGEHDLESYIKDIAFGISTLDANYVDYNFYYYDFDNTLQQEHIDKLLSNFKNIKDLKTIVTDNAELDINSLAIAYPSKVLEDFNLLKPKFDTQESSFIIKSSIISIILIVTTVIILAAHNYIALGKIRSEITKSQQIIKKNLISLDPKQKNILSKQNTTAAIKKSLTDMKKKINQDSIWFAFSKKTKFSYLKYLQELSKIINLNTTELRLEQLSFTDKSILMKASVPGFEQLNKLTEQLNKSEAFQKINSPQETNFTIELKFKNNGAA